MNERLPVIPWREGMKVPLPEGHVPSYVDVGDGHTIDEARLPWILDAILAEHPEAERLREVAAAQPGLNVRPMVNSPFVEVSLAGEIIGYFDRRHLDA